MKKHLHPITIGNVVVPWNIALAPMAGTSTCIFRTIAHECGSALDVTELVSARGIRFKESVEHSMRYLEIDPAHEGKTAIQLFGFDPEDFAYAIPFLLEDPRLSQVDIIDINMGCPVSKVVKTGSGSALMKDPAQAEKIIRACVRAAAPYAKPVTVKFRSGWDEEHITAPEFAKMCVQAGAAGLALHARTQTQMYHGQADWGVITETKAAISDTGIPLWGNGDVKDGASAIRMLEETGADGVMVGRAAQGNPWVFTEIKTALSAEAEAARATTLQDGAKTVEAAKATTGTSAFAPDRKTRVEVIRRHLIGLCGQLGETTGVKEMRAQIAFYLKGGRGTAEIKNRLMMANTVSEVEALLSEYQNMP
ncbi:MAG: tRNA-dihydrouridine synthase [Clostridiales bacterium]|nr:tRNA-dihydrouridine synthase [Clostridiales bacterium]MBR5977641.1 tRNA-dihydrouridine synthase [Verrucomicrobiota bacterium]